MQFTAYATTLFISALVSGALAVFAWRRRKMLPAGTEMFLLLSAVALWSLCSSLESASLAREAKIFWSVITYVGSQSAPVLFFLFALRYTQQDSWLNGRRIAFLLIVPLASFLLAATNQWHHVLWPAITLKTGWAGVTGIFKHGSWYWFMITYDYLLMLLGMLALLRAAFSRRTLYSRQALFILLAALVPWVGNIAYSFLPSSLEGVDLTPIAFAVTGVLVTGAVFRYRLLDLGPIARDVLFESVRDVMVATDAAGRIVDVNPVGEELLGRSEREVIGLQAAEAFAGRPDLVERMTGGRREDHSEVEIVRDGARRHFDMQSWPLVGHNDRVLGRLVTMHDITELKLMQNELLSTKERLENLLRSSPAVIYSCEPGGVYPRTYMSDNVILQLGYSAEEFLSDPCYWKERIHPEDADRVLSDMTRVFEDGNFSHEYRLLQKNGTYRHIYDEFRLLSDPDGDPREIVGYWIDVTERREAEEAIEKLNAELLEKATELQAANRELEAFGYSVSHDLRAPLRAIHGFSQILLEEYADKLDDEGRRVLDVILSNTHSMGQLIDDILALSRAGRHELRSSTIDMASIADEVYLGLGQTVNGRRIRFTVSQLPPATGDKNLIRQVFVNLISNAIKFTGNRELAIIEVGAIPYEGETAYFVKDNGAGFDMRYADKLFGVFQRLHSADEYEGTGVGLALVQRIVRRHHGRVWAEAAVESGATFYFTLPLEEVA